ncbi:PREDICTED: polygalacturonase inhibitor-like [Nelumbo nucifera]|uniref:Polygalacturonase inhibitor-like n=1 Tax=Nelumbo nucifera TaxID=4432 RepID=A0A1U8Q6T8_NELNU|nr:PREDICTED: polygalacturonase inhibitor-like [Nelumbo nucifera]
MTKAHGFPNKGLIINRSSDMELIFVDFSKDALIAIHAPQSPSIYAHHIFLVVKSISNREMDTPLLSVLLLFLLVSCSLPSLTLSAYSFRCHASDKRVLWKIKKSLKIPHYFDSWNPSTDCCNWNYVGCDPSDRVTQILFYNIHTPFKIPEAVGDLPFLKTLDFDDIPNFTGSIPYSITKLQNLEILRIWNTSLSGPIPEFLSQLKNLRYLHLGYNQLSGPIPSSLANLNKLQSLDLLSNKFTGTIPDSFGSFKDGEYGVFSLHLSHNQLSGGIPTSINVSSIDLSHNKLSGDASMLLRENGAAEWIYLSHNQLDFDLTKVKFPKNLKVLDLSHNQIHGNIPKQLINKLDLESMDLSYNQLCGKIPFGGNVQKMGAKSFAHNRCLCGPPLPNKCK